jgi:NADH-quinone oxidoreductase subunit E
MNHEDVTKIIEKYRSTRGGLISILEEVQAKYGYLPQKALVTISEEMGLSMVDVYGVATFYRAFRLKPRGKHLVSVCLGTACHVRGGQTITEQFENELKIKSRGDTTADREFTLETVRCLGACAIAPVVVVDGHYFPQVNTGRVKDIVDRARTGLDRVEIGKDERVFPLEVKCPKCNHTLMDRERLIDGHPSVRLTISYGEEHGWMRLSSLYGSYAVESGNEIPPETLVNFFCPHCNAELIGAWNCGDCSAPMIPMIVQGGGIVQICSRRGCKSHMLDLSTTAVE